MSDFKHTPGPQAGQVIPLIGGGTATWTVPEDVVRLVIAARVVAYDSAATIESAAAQELDQALEAFAQLVPWDDEPDDADATCKENLQVRGGGGQPCQ